MSDAHPGVVITGIGMVTSLGIDATECASNWQAGRVATRRRVAQFDGTPLEGTEAAVLPDVEGLPYSPSRRMRKFMSYPALLGAVAAHEAFTESAAAERFAPERIGLYAATGLATVSLDDTLPMLSASLCSDGSFSCRLFGTRGLGATNPLLSFRTLANMPPCLVSIAQSIKGPSYIFTPWEGQTGAALVEAWKAVEDGEVDAALAGAAEDASSPAAILFLRQAGILTENELPAAGAAYVLLERYGSAVRAGRRPYALVADMCLGACECPAHDSLSGRLGRTFAAAPVVLLALSARLLSAGNTTSVEHSICGVDRQRFTFRLEKVQ